MTRHDPREPLDADERELAGRLSRLGADGPSPALDAKILAAARAAAAPPRTTRKRRHWLAWASIPPAAITGIGVAAACVLALGLVWQMRPRVSMAPTRAEPEEEVFIVADMSAARAPVANPPPLEESAAEAADMAAPSPPASERVESRAEPAPALAAAGAQPDARAQAAAPAAAAPAPDAFKAAAAPAEADASAPMAAEASAADSDASANAPHVDDAGAAAKVRRPTYTSTARATSEQTRRRQAFAPPPSPMAPNAQETTTFPADARQTQRGTPLQRAEATGSSAGTFDPKSLAGLAPTEDRTLDRDDWMLRIRARRDAGDLTGARESLRLFRKQYPRVHLPEDLRKLAADAAP